MSFAPLTVGFYTYKEAEYELLMGWIDILLRSPETLPSSIDTVKRVRDECIPFLPDLKQSFLAQCYNYGGYLHEERKWEEVVKWCSLIIESCEKESHEGFRKVREKSLYLLCDAYIALHDESKSLLCLQLCTQPECCPIQFLYLKYYIEIKDNEKAIEAMQKLTALAGDDDQSMVLDAARLLCDACSLSSAAQATLLSPSSVTRSVMRVAEQHPQWKAAVRATVICCYLHSPALCDQCTSLLDQCIEGGVKMER